MSNATYGTLERQDGTSVPLSQEDQDRLEAGESLTIEGRKVEFLKIGHMNWTWLVDGQDTKGISE